MSEGENSTHFWEFFRSCTHWNCRFIISFCFQILMILCKHGILFWLIFYLLSVFYFIWLKKSLNDLDICYGKQLFSFVCSHIPIPLSWALDNLLREFAQTFEYPQMMDISICCYILSCCDEDDQQCICRHLFVLHKQDSTHISCPNSSKQQHKVHLTWMSPLQYPVLDHLRH